MDKKPLFTIFFVIFIDLLGFGILVPILPYYADHYGASATALGWLMMSYSAMQFIFAPVWGRISDRVGRKPVLVATLMGLGISHCILGWAPSLIWLFVGRMAAGLFGANISTATAYIADVTTPENRAKGMGLIGAAFGLGFLVGPAVGGLLAKWGYDLAAFAAAGFSFLSFVFAIFFLHEPQVSAEIRRQHRNRPSMEIWKLVLGQKKTALVILLFFLVTLGMAQLETSFGLFLLKRFGLDAFHAGLFLALMAFIMVCIQGGGIGKLVKKFGEVKLVLAGALLMAGALLWGAFVFNVWFLIPVMIFYGAGFAMASPSLQSLVSRSAPADIQGSVMGVYHSFGSLARILGPLLAGFLFDRAGISFPFVAASLVFIICFVLVTIWGRLWLSNQKT